MLQALLVIGRFKAHGATQIEDSGISFFLALLTIHVVEIDRELLIALDIQALINGRTHPRWLQTVPLGRVGVLVSFRSLLSVHILSVDRDPAIVFAE